MINKKTSQLITVVCLILIGVLGRIFLRQFLPSLPHTHITINGITQPIFVADMFFIVALVSIFSGLLLRGYYTLAVPIAVMIITDVLYGNTYLFLFTWSGFTFIALFAYSFSKKLTYSPKSALQVLGLGIGTIFLYDLWTNFGWWLGPYYPHTIDGLALCFTLAVPFMVWHLLSTSLLLVLLIFPVLYIKDHHLKLGTITPLENYTPLFTSLFIAIVSLLVVIT